jgi:hypothetical protein
VFSGKEQTAFRRVKHIEQDIQMVHQMIDHGLLRDRHIEDDGTSYMDGAKTGVHNNGTGSDNTSTSTEQRVADVSDMVYVELGAGKGLLGLAVNCADPEATLVLVERGVNKNKVSLFPRVRVLAVVCIAVCKYCLDVTIHLCSRFIPRWIAI